MSKVTIYMSSYNHAKYLTAAIQSVLDQTFADFELFILDDASKDESWTIIQSFSDPRIRSHRNPVNRNDKEWMRKVVFEMGTGEYIAIHHSDNVWEPGKLQKQVDFLDKYAEAGAVFTNARIIDENSAPSKNKGHFYYSIFNQPNRSRFEWLNTFFYHGNVLCHPSTLIRKKCYEECGFYRNGFAQIPDLDMWVRLCLKYEIHVLPEKLVQFRIPPNDQFVSGSRPESRIRYHFEFLQVLENYLEIPSFQELTRVFPSAVRYSRKEGSDIGYVLARVALETSGQMTARLFGLNILFDALNDPARMNRIKELYDFSQKDFIALTAKNDVFSMELGREFGNIRTSPAWRVAQVLHRITIFLFPPGSVRLMVVKRIFAFGRRRKR